MASNKKYWKSVEELDNNSIVETLQQNEFLEEIPTTEFLGDKESLDSSSTTRRDFLKYVGFSTAAATLAACEGPVVKSIPYVVQPEQIRPGVADYYATTIADGYDFASILVKTREGRPIKIEPNKMADFKGCTNARVQASVLSLYDNKRLKSPKANGAIVSWSKFDADIAKKVNEVVANGKEVVLMTQTFASPSTSNIIAEFKAKYGNVRHVVYDAISESATLDAFQEKYGERGMPNYNLGDADVIVAIGADFLGDWQGGGFEGDYAKNRIPENGKMSRHIQFESNMTLSGANADKRVPLTPSEQKVALAKLYGYIAGSSVGGSLPKHVDAAVKKAAEELKRAGSRAVVLTGIQDKGAQAVSNAINEALGSKAFDAKSPIKTRQGSNAAVNQLVADVKSGKVGAVIMAGINPVYSMPNGNAFGDALKKLPLTVSFTQREDETSKYVQYLGAAPHYLESWGDVELKKGSYSLMQPTIKPLFDTRQFQDFLLKLVGSEDSYYKYIKNTWSAGILGGSSWNKALHDGVLAKSAAPVVEENQEGDEVASEEAPVYSVSGAVAALAGAKSKGLELTLYPKTAMGDGQMANNPWLQELPDPLTRTTWDNYLTISEADAKKFDLFLEQSTFFTQARNDANGGLNGKYANVTVNGVTVEKVPVIIQPGQAQGSVGLSFGYGRKEALQAEMQTGVNAYPLYANFNNVQTVSIAKTDGKHEFACIQLHNTLMGRGDIVKDTTLEIFNTANAKHDYEAYNPKPKVSKDHNMINASDPEADLWTPFDRSIGHHFNLSIDLNACTGCGACVVACHAENNVPVVGKSEVRRSRDMHWLRIDRYYSSQDTFNGDLKKKENISGLGSSLSEFGEMESPAANPQVAFQPVMCQHCNHAPCETVCPVAATSHGRQGQNHMAYNRCVGTRYCANNCPYKVRRFNWFLYNNNDEFDYNMNNDLGKMVLNPDVVVRSRGVMEKCSMCIQMTQKTILDAKVAGKQVDKNAFATACSNACDTGAMVFGDINDKNNDIYKKKNDKRAYHLLEHIGTEPNVVYQVKVRNTKEA
ncbi:TAT-variant-translocated molybdopterin oxidoreductase [Pseudofulvibacter geojedonensis]|uniref:TAT-variant-translocated molybdopterin oxidoreductase n=1 Tax=Pseudofulvibacter geojedonensis TaxID=1123758 RepID=A0ABW3I1Q7_9FLAO